MPTVEETVAQIVAAPSWDERVSRLRQVPHAHGVSDHAAIYARVAAEVYVPHLTPDFAYIIMPPFYERAYFERAYEATVRATEYFTNVDPPHLAQVLMSEPRSLLVLRVLTGLVPREFADASAVLTAGSGRAPLSVGRVNSMERDGATPSEAEAAVAAETLHRLMAKSLFPEPSAPLQFKTQKPDTEDGWKTAEWYARNSVPFSVLLHQRHYGGAFRQVLDATSGSRGAVLENAVADLLGSSHIRFLQTGSSNQAEIEHQFNLVVRPAPDFVIYDERHELRAILECKVANDGGTARDKAARFAALKREAIRLNGIPVIAVLAGLGWSRTNDALGPVVRDCDGRVFTIPTLPNLLTVSPFPDLM